MYGVETIIDLFSCDIAKFNRKDIKAYFLQTCKLLDVRPEDCYFWDDLRVPMDKQQTNPKTKGTTAIQFILTSNITIHTLDLLRIAFVNIFSCKYYDAKLLEEFTARFFGSSRHRTSLIERGVE
jgi:S-adenosylmethionine/arginine decarboxylase-like enzyme